MIQSINILHGSVNIVPGHVDGYGYPGNRHYDQMFRIEVTLFDEAGGEWELTAQYIVSWSQPEKPDYGFIDDLEAWGTRMEGGVCHRLEIRENMDFRGDWLPSLHWNSVTRATVVEECS